MTDRDDALPDVQQARADVQGVGLRRYAITIRKRTWAGGFPGIGAMTPTDLVITPTPRVRQLHSREIAASGGTYEQGDYRVDKITPGFCYIGIGFVTATGSGLGTVTPTNSVPSPGVNIGTYAVLMTILAPGPVGTATFQYTLDGITTLGPITTAASVSLPGAAALPSGLGAEFSGTFETGDTFAFPASSGGFTPSQLKPIVTAANTDIAIMLTGDDGVARSCGQVGPIAFDRAFGYSMVIRPRRESA